MGLLALSIAPGIAICLYIYFKDKYNKEPIGTLIISFILGMLCTIPAIIFQINFGHGLSVDQLQGRNISFVAQFAYGIVAFSEEASKFLVLLLFCYRRKSFDEPFDGIVYAVMVGMGFATFENIGYVMQGGIGTGITRMFLSVPAHGTFAILMGYFTGIAKFSNRNRGLNFFLALLLPIFFHGSFDFFLFLQSVPLHFLGALVSLIVAISLSKKAITKNLQLSQNFSSNFR